MHKILTLLRLSPFKLGCLLVMAAALFFYSFGDTKPELLTTLDNRLVDVLFHWRGRMPTTDSVVIVDIDDKSLAEIGQWPWPRDVIAKLVSAIHAKGAKAIGFDILFAEPDRTSPKYYISELAQIIGLEMSDAELEEIRRNEALDHDIILGDALADAPTILGYSFVSHQAAKADDVPFPSCNIHMDSGNIAFSDIKFFEANGAVVNIPDVAQAESEGFFNVFSDSAGTVRKVPLFMSLNGVPYPSMALETLRVGLDKQNITIHVSRKVQTARKGVVGVTLAGRFIPTDDNCQVYVNFRGDYGTFPYISAVDVLRDEKGHDFSGKYVLVGTSAAALGDLRATPFSISNTFPGVEIHANVIDNLLSSDPLIHDTYGEIGLTYTIVIVGGLLLSALLAYATPLAGGLGGLLFLLAPMAGSYFFFLNNRVVGITYPILTIAVIFLVVTLSNYFFEGRERRYIHDAFGHYVSPHVVNQIMKDPASLSLAGELKELTVFFSDIRDFTSISEQMSPDVLGRFMNEYLTAMSTIIMEHDGTVDKYIGDAIMAIWGAPLDDSDHVAKALSASLASISRLNKLNERWKRKGLPEIDIGIGLNTGEMSVGNFGSSQRFDYTVLGDNVNLASRLEGLNKVYGTNILITRWTRDAVGDNFFCRLIDRVRVKGKDLPVSIYEPVCKGMPDDETKKETADFEQALMDYRARNFDKALQIISELDSRNPKKFYKLYMDRIGVFKESPPPEDWDGVFTHRAK
ncbi:MAG: adenylate/guanylate cyclase domain-containing protein [Desulfobulbaceae bacterium]|nr:adenylate/guanylate cyclase domain-containing protein [Desulfobulbaceae bacterium]